MDKAIRVRVVEREDGRTAYAWQDVTINREHTLQMAVQATYPAFPGACQTVVVTDATNPGGGVVVWDTGASEASWMRDKYDTIRAGGKVEIWVRTWQPDGGDWAGAGKPVAGPQGARVAALPGELKRLGDVTVLEGWEGWKGWEEDIKWGKTYKRAHCV